MLWAMVSVVVFETTVLAVSALPAVALWSWGARLSTVPPWGRVLFLAALAIPGYIVFALGVLGYSAFGARLLGWRTAPNLDEPLRGMTWPVLNWGRYMISTHVASQFAGPVFRSTPFWAMYMRWNGARIGRGVWVNSLSLMDHNLLTLDDEVVIGSDTHMSGHTVERGMLKTAAVYVGRGATLGVGCVVGIGSTIGAGTVVGALSVVPKGAVLQPHATYAGAPAVRLADTHHAHQ